jgi:uncharacterized protein YraI
MKFKILRIIMIVFVLFGLFSISYTYNPPITVQAQQPTGSVPTVTPLSTGPTATVKVGIVDHVVVRNGPSTLYDQVGVILPGTSIPVAGKTSAGDWLLIKYPGAPGGEGWVWALYMDVVGGELPIVEIPPTPTPKITATIDPTMAAQFVITAQATRLPTFTAPAPLTVPTYSTGVIGNGRVPVGLVILMLAGLGALFGLISFVQSR